MDTASEDCAQPDVDAVMTMLAPADVSGQDVDASDEIESLRNSLRESVHDDSVRPKMQCLMMDSSFSMVTMQGEDSGIAWETTPSGGNTPRASESGAAEVSSPVAGRPATPGSHPAGRIIFLMDEEMISRRRKPKERPSSQRSRAEKGWDVPEGSADNISGRPELVEVSQPNVKSDEGDRGEAADSTEDKEQRLFSIVSEGLEILNIVVPHKMATVDEEESKEMTDNLSYLRESLVPRAGEDAQDAELPIFGAGPGAGAVERPAAPAVAGVMDPPGAPVARPPPRGAAGNVDYFEAFSMVDAQAPGGPAVVKREQEEAETRAATEGQDSDHRPESEGDAFAAMADKSDAISLGEIPGELLDEVFYAGTESFPVKSPDAAEGATPRLPSKPSGSNLFGSQEDVLTPIFLPEGPPKIIDPILLEEPKAMAFLYTDLYEEALGTWKKDEDAESMTSEKSFHSRHSDREARGYLEKYVLIDETPAVEVEPADEEEGPEGGARVLAQDLYDFPDFQASSEKGETQYSEEVTDFLRSSGNSSPYEMEPFRPSLEEDDTQTSTEPKAKTEKSVTIAVEKVPETPADPLSISSFEFPPDEPDWGGPDDYPPDLDEEHVAAAHRYQEPRQQDAAINKPVAPPRRKAASSPKARLDLTPLTPVDGIAQDNEEVGAKEQREEEKETASPAETTDEGDGDGDETPPASPDAALLEDALAALKPESAGGEGGKDSEERDAKPDGEKDTKPEEGEARSETWTETGLKEADVETEINAETRGATSTASSDEPAKKGQCVIL